MQELYPPTDVQAAVQKIWQAQDVYRVNEHTKDAHGAEKPKFYACSMLPYPSGKLHMGHVRNYTINDMMARQRRMRGYNVLMPMGWDAFGMPAENAAIKSHVSPAHWTYTNIAYMRKQMQAIGLAIDWSREISACDPNYYKWNQWLFLKMLEKGIAYRKTQVVNWDPVDQTVLANEQVIDGRGWRSGARVEKREIPGYYLRITDYAEELLTHLTTALPGWPERVRTMQENWLGKNTGVRFAFLHTLRDENGALIQNGQLHVFTTRADTLMGVTFCAVAPEHPLATHAALTQPTLAAFIEQCKLGGTTEAELATREKVGMPTGLFVTHPLTGQNIAVWVGNYVLMHYGEGAVMGVPAHDERDFMFAQKYGLAIHPVIDVDGQPFTPQTWQPWYADKENGRLIHSGKYDGLSSAQAIDAIAADLSAAGLGEKQTTWRLRDWGISRQRYWGTPIPIIHCTDCGPVPVPEQDLPVLLPENLIPDGSGNPLAQDADFLSCHCPRCHQPARRETDTMDTFVDSAWYFMRYTSPDNPTAMVDARSDYWMPIDQYIGGIEHAVLHLLYARFWTKVMRDLGLLTFDEPFVRLLCQGMVLNHIYSRKTAQGGIEYFWPDDVDNLYDAKGAITGARCKADASAVTYEGVGTMSKSKNNGVDPQALIDTLGADTVRLFIIFASAPEQTLEWSEAGLQGAHRFLRRLWTYCWRHRTTITHGLAAGAPAEHPLPTAARDVRREIHTLLRQADYDYERIQYNTVVSACMKMLNALENATPPSTTQPSLAHGADPAPIASANNQENNAQIDSALAMDTPCASVYAETLSVLLRVLYPVVPHITWYLWRELGYSAHYGDLLDAPWPQVDPTALVIDEIELVLQINGKLRSTLRVPASATPAQVEAQAITHQAVAHYLQGRAPKRVIVVPNKLVNIVG